MIFKSDIFRVENKCPGKWPNTLASRAGDTPQKNRKEGVFVIPVLKSSEKFYAGKPIYHKNTSIPSKYRYTVKIPVWTSTHIY